MRTRVPPKVTKTANGQLPPRVQLCCPNPACGRDDCLVLIEQGIVTTAAKVFDAGVTAPEVEMDFDTEEVEPELATRRLLGWRCTACSQGYKGPDPLKRLARPAA